MEFWLGQGAKILPLNERKAPVGHLVPHGLKDASDNPRELWWSQHETTHYIGLVPGSLRCVVLDVDIKGDKQGNIELDKLIAEHGEIPQTAWVATPSGGWHIWLRKPIIHSVGHIGNHVFCPGVDVRSDGGYVVAPGSEGYGALPRDFSVDKVPLMPQWVADRLVSLQAEEAAKAAEYSVERQDRIDPQDWHDKVGTAFHDFDPRGSDRHQQMIETVNRLASYELLDYAGATTALDDLRLIFVDAVSDRSDSAEANREYQRALVGARQRVSSRESTVLEARSADDTFIDAIKNATKAAAPLPPELTPEPPEEADPHNEEEFWESRPILSQIRQAARAMRKGPWAVLGCVLVRACMHIPHYVVVPMRPGNRGSGIPLNVYVAAVGASGGGKGGAVTASKLAVRWPESERVMFGEVDLGSGEGLMEQYAEINNDGDLEWRHRAVGFVCNEVDAFGATKGRSGSTLEPVVRSAWSGEALGFGYRGKRVKLPENEYRIGIIMGVQPGRAAAITGAEASDGGTPQRFNFMPLPDPGAPDVLPPMPSPMDWTEPRWPAAMLGPFSDGLAYLDVAPEIHAEIDAAQLSDLRGDTREGHEPQSRLRIAAVLAVLDQRTNVTTDDWHIAGAIRRVSNITVEQCQNEAKASQHREKAEDEMLRNAHRVSQERVCTRVLASPALLGGGEWRSKSELRRALARDEREVLGGVLSSLLTRGQIIQRQAGRGVRYRLAGDTDET